VLACSPKTYAGASNKNGNPFGNGSFFPNSGTFSAIERSSNGYLGVMQFSTSATNSSTNSLTNSGVATIYANGQQFVGPAFGSVNGSTIAATYIGSYSFGILVPTVEYDTNGNITSTTYSDKVISNQCSGQFTASLQNAYPNQIFSGQGQNTVITKDLNPATFIITTTTTQYNTSVSGSRLTQ
jgi:hypothetical protein